MEPHLPETLRRLNALIEEQDLARSEVLDVQRLAQMTALDESTVRHLIDGGNPPEDTVNDRVCARLKNMSDARMVRTGRRMSDLASEVAERLHISNYWARQLCSGKKTPNVEVLRGLAEFFQVEGAEAFFTAPADEALNRVLLPVLKSVGEPGQDPVQALLEKYGVQAVDLRHANMTADQMERLLAGVLQSVLPPKRDTKQ
ncbi:helix-turn-helix domain-containing protein [Streptomyces goshikiensis]